jgi:DNA-binding XRE family transcriptional regulator
MIGDRIRELREARAWTQAHLADAAGIGLRTIQRLETLHSCSPETLLALASALEIDVRSLTEERSAAPAWTGRSAPAAAWWGAAFAAPCLIFVAVNLLKYGAGVAAPYDLIAGIGAIFGLTAAFDWLSPFMLLGGPLAAVLINLRALVRPRLRWDGRGATLTALDMRMHRASLAVLLAAGAGLFILSAYLVSETIGHIARAAV